MPCIVCKKERRASMRLPLEGLSEGRERWYRSQYFTNHDFDHVCRICSVRDRFWNTLANSMGMAFDLVVRSLLVLMSVLLAYALGVGQGWTGTTLDAAPVVFGLLVGGVLGFRFLRWVAYAALGLLAATAFVVMMAYSDYLSVLPDLKAMAQREQLKEYGEVRWEDDASRAASAKTTGTSEYDPIEASRDRAEKVRREKVLRFLRGLRAASPFALWLTPRQLERIQLLAGITLGIYYVLLVILRLVLPAPGPPGDAREARAR